MGLPVPERSPSLVAASMAAGHGRKHSTQTVAESSHTDSQAGSKEAHWEWCESFETSKPIPSAAIFQ